MPNSGELVDAMLANDEAKAVEIAQALVNAGVDAVIIDTAHGHTKGVVSVLKDIKSKFPELEVVVGNMLLYIFLPVLLNTYIPPLGPL